VPIRTPRAVVERLNREILGVLAQPAMIAALDAQGLDPAGSAPAQFDRLVRAEIKKWTKLARAARIQVD
jgi:tripartite-type tricarboxylate transporter receptor subunit TctC